jgi:DNA mismatch repair protein MutL
MPSREGDFWNSLVIKCPMSRITVLPVGIRNKIAAGEVIERPSSVVKELIENALDAGGADLCVEVLSGGRRMIRVSDNGTGMDRDDALLCFERHATSKIAGEDDLFNIRTLGFRGEALPSIASVAKVKLVTGIKGAPSGISVEIHGGERGEVREASFSGTVIEVRDLFFNTPARKKFLKTDATELLHIVDAVTREALSHYETGFRLLTDRRETMVLPGASGLRERIMQIYGEEFLNSVREVNVRQGDTGMHAFISHSANFRNSKSHQFIFINERPVKDASLSHAVYAAYEGIIPADKHPIFFLCLDLDPREIDFNVHPAKREVRFRDKETVHRFVRSRLREVIKGDRTQYAAQFTETADTGSYSGQRREEYQSSPFSSGTSSVSENAEFSYTPSLPFIYLGDTFIAFSGKGGLTLIDHHAAHERILYEKFLGGLSLPTHRLLFPEQVRLSFKEYKVILENKGLLSEFGIEVDDFGHDTVIVRSLPESLQGADLRGIIADVASAIIEGVNPNRSLKESLAAKIACHSSVRGKAILNQEEFARLLADLDASEHPDQCPHGRPTRVFYSLEDLKKIFKRK